MARRKFSVHVFSHDVGLEIKVPYVKNTCRVSVDIVSDAIGKKLKLNADSLKIFGLFLGPLGSPTKLLLSGEMMPDEVPLDLCYQRLCFDAGEERRVTKTDITAMELIFWELKYKLENGKIWPAPTLLKMINFKEILEKHDSGFDSLCNDTKRVFVEQMRSLSLFYWSRFYMVTDCLLKSCTASNLHFGDEVLVALEFDKFVMIDKETCNTLSWPWSVVRGVWLQKHPRSTFVIEILILRDKTCMLRNVFVETSQSEYLFSMAIHILRLHKKLMDDTKKPIIVNWFGTYYKYHNQIFNSRVVLNTSS